MFFIAFMENIKGQTGTLYGCLLVGNEMDSVYFRDSFFLILKLHKTTWYHPREFSRQQCTQECTIPKCTLLIG